jgi:hypothetical protein
MDHETHICSTWDIDLCFSTIMGDPEKFQWKVKDLPIGAKDQLLKMAYKERERLFKRLDYANELILKLKNEE